MKEPNWFYPFIGMDTGDSFFVPSLTPEVLMYKISLAAKEYGIRIRSALRVEDQVMGVRVWKVE